MADYDRVTQASLNGIYVKAQELDRDHNCKDAPLVHPAGFSVVDEPNASPPISDTETHASAQAHDSCTHAPTHDSDSQTHASDT